MTQASRALTTPPLHSSSSDIDDEADIEDIVTLSELLCVMMAQLDADAVLAGMHRVMLIIADRARDLRERLYGTNS
jgi:hypothetical protein